MPIPVPNPYDTLPEVPSFSLTSDDMTDGQRLADAHVHDSASGGNVSPSLSWSGAPAGRSNEEAPAPRGSDVVSGPSPTISQCQKPEVVGASGS